MGIGSSGASHGDGESSVVVLLPSEAAEEAEQAALADRRPADVARYYGLLAALDALAGVRWGVAPTTEHPSENQPKPR